MYRWGLGPKNWVLTVFTQKSINLSAPLLFCGTNIWSLSSHCCCRTSKNKSIIHWSLILTYSVGDVALRIFASQSFSSFGLVKKSSLWLLSVVGVSCYCVFTFRLYTVGVSTVEFMCAAKVSEPAEKLCSESVQPYLGSVLEELMEPLSSGFQEGRRLIEALMDKVCQEVLQGDNDQVKKVRWSQVLLSMYFCWSCLLMTTRGKKTSTWHVLYNL